MLAMLLCFWAGTTVEQDAHVLSYLLKAQYAQVRHEYTLAKEYADRALALNPESADAAFLRLEIVYTAMRRTPIQLAEQRQRYLAELEQRLKQHPQDYRFLKFMGNLMVQNRWARESRPQTPDFYLSQALQLMHQTEWATNEEKADVYFDLGHWYFNSDQPYKATLAFGKIEDLDPDNVSAMEALARSAQNAHMLRLALDAYKKYSKRSEYIFEGKATPIGNAIHMLEYLLQPTPEHLQALLDYFEETRGDLATLTRIGDRMVFMGMEEHLPTFLANVPVRYQGTRYYQLYLLGLMSQGRFNDVVQLATDPTKRFDEKVLALVMEHGMEAAFLSGDYATCLALAERHPEVKVVSARFELYAAFAAAFAHQDMSLWEQMQARRGPDDGMVRFVSQAITAISFEEFALRNRVQLLRQFGAYDQALAVLAEHYPNGYPENLLEEVAITHVVAGNPEKAFPYYETLVQNNPERADYHNNYGYFLADAGVDLEKAKALISKALELQPETPAYLDSYGWVHYKSGDLQTAETYIREALRFEPENSEKLEHLGDVYRRLGKEDIAREYWSQAMNQGGARYLDIMEKLDPDLSN